MSKIIPFELKYKIASIYSSCSSSRQSIGHRSFVYHSIYKDNHTAMDYYTISQEKFKIQMRYLSSQKIAKIVSFNNAISSEEGLTISITIDDGWRDTYENAAPVLEENSIPFTVFVTSDYVKKTNRNYLNKSQLVSLSLMSGVTIGAHGKSHLPLASLDNKSILHELRDSKAYLEDTLSKKVELLSYPHGSTDDRVIKIARETGFIMAGCSNWGINYYDQSPFMIKRIFALRMDTLNKIKQKITGKWDWMGKYW